MTSMTEIHQTTQVYHVFINASPEQIWEAITKPEFTEKYFHGSHVDSDLEPGRPFVYRSPDREQLWVDGQVVESDPPRKLVHTWRSLYSEEQAAEEPSRVTWEIEQDENGVSKLTVVHDQLEGAPKTAAGVSGEGWMSVLSGLKTLLETGRPLGG
jgi:uncharacterized protein YndB with AHSA1/START domain